MAKNMKQFYAIARLRDPQAVYGHAMPFTMLSLGGGNGTGRIVGACFVDIFVTARGSSVPISRGGPPILYE